MSNAAENAVKKVIIASAPERENELLQMWDEHQPQINQIDDKTGFTFEAGSFCLVLFNHKTMCQIWLFGFAAQYSLNLYLPYLLLSQFTGMLFSPSDISTQEEALEINEKIFKLFASIKELKDVEKIEDIEWPDDVPRPEGGKPKDVNGSMVFDLLCIASAYCFLHELKHVQFSNMGQKNDPIQEEHECDKYARDFLLDKIEDYSRSTGFDLGLLKNKRGMAMALATILLFIITPENLWRGSSSHPSIVSRIKELVNSLSISDNDYFWSYLSCLLLSKINNNRISINSSIVKTQREYCFILLNAMDSHIIKS